MNLAVGLLHQGPASSKRIQEVDDAHQSPHPHHGKRAVLAIARCPGNGTLAALHGMSVY